MLNDYNTKKDFMVEWVNRKGKLHKTKVNNKFVSASDAAEYIYNSRKTCVKVPEAYWI